ncbi:MAG: filamentous hemagglutinin N-terminal domain-containing protein, partial [Desulfobacterales bacterium]|nr:filamentous hemagglutinin N-terminal domain-containing protein [Desulfobacterales bacterium]
MNHFHRLLITACFLLSMAAPVYGVDKGKIVLDGSLGPGGDLSGPHFDIKADYGRMAGDNLFHSFHEFSLVNEEIATFRGPASVENIISRVTGGAGSSIDGTIRSTIPEANIYLLNPAGVIFGENASLDIGGSFHVSTADYLRMGENDRFYSRPTAGEVLVSAAPTAFGFLDSDVGEIKLTGKEDSRTNAPTRLIVPADQTISLVGGDIDISRLGDAYKDENGEEVISGGLTAPGGRVDIASVKSPGEVAFTDAGLDVTSATLGNITITDGSVIDVSGNGSGNVFIRGGEFFLGGGSVIAADSTDPVDPTETNANGVIDIMADVVKVEDSDIFSDAKGSGKGGDIKIVGTESVTVKGISRVFADATNTNQDEDKIVGDAGSLEIFTTRLSIENGGKVSSETSGRGQGGNITLRASESIHLSGDGSTIYGGAKGTTENAGDAGAITMETKSLSLANGAIINSDTKYGGGAGGSIIIRGYEGEGHCAELVKVDNSQIYAGAINGEFEGKGQGGIVDIRANRIALTNGGSVDAISKGKGNAGAIIIEANDSIRLDGQSEITTTAENEGNAGEINLRTSDLFLDHGSVVTSESESESTHAGKAGKITVIAGDSVELFAGGRLTTQAAGAGGGQIDVTAGNMIYLLDGEITSSVKESEGESEGKGGDVRTESEFVILNNADITAKAELGDGGAIFIKTDNYFKSADSEVSAASKRGNDGTVTIQAPDLDITSGLVSLPTTFLDVTRWVETPCAERSGESVSRFVMKG